MNSQSNFNIGFSIAIGLMAIWILSLTLRPAPSITDVIRNTNFENKKECDALVKGLLAALKPCGNTALTSVCNTCRSGNVPDSMKPVCSSPTIIGACAGV